MDYAKVVNDTKPALQMFENKLLDLVMSMIQRHEDITEEEKKRNGVMVMGMAMVMLHNSARLNLKSMTGDFDIMKEANEFGNLAKTSILISAING